MTQRYAGLEQQLRFTRGAYSYVLYSMDANEAKGSNAVSGIVVIHGSRRIADLSCLPHATFGENYDFDELPQDTGAFTAM